MSATDVQVRFAAEFALFLVSLIYPIYYFALSFWLNFRRNLTPL